MSKKQKQPKTLLQVNLDRGRFLKQLRQVAPGAAKGSLLPVLQAVKIEADAAGLTLCTTNLDVYVKVKSGVVDDPAAHVIEQPGEALLPLRPLLDVFGKWADERVVLTVVEGVYNEGKLLPADGSTVALLRSETAEADIRFEVSLLDWPEMKLEGEAGLTLTGSELTGALADVGFCAARDEARPILTGILLTIKDKLLTAVAADGFRLGCKIVPLSQPDSDGFDLTAILPGVAARLLLKLIDEPEELIGLTVDLSREPGRFKFSGLSFEVITTLLGGQYPDYERIIPQPNGGDCLTVASLETFKRGINSIVPYVDRVRWVRMEHGQPVKLFAKRDDVGQSEVEIPVISTEGGSCPHAFNVDYLLPLGERSGDKISFRNRPDTENDPLVIEIDDAVKYVIMPMHINR